MLEPEQIIDYKTAALRQKRIVGIGTRTETVWGRTLEG